MDASPLAKLSAEVRNIIYEITLSVLFPLVLEADESCKKFRGGSERINLNALTKTCRQIRFETTQMSYALNDFTIFCNDSFRIHEEIVSYKLPTGVVMDVLCTFDEKALFCGIIGPRNTAALRSFELRVSLMSLLDISLWGASLLNLCERKRHVHNGWWKVTFMRKASDSNPHAGAVCLSLDVGKGFISDCAYWTSRLEENREEDAPMHQAKLKEQFFIWRTFAINEEERVKMLN